MPSKSAKQAKLFAAVAHGWEPPGRKPIPKSVGVEFHEADKRVGKFEHPRSNEGHKGRLERLKSK